MGRLRRLAVAPTLLAFLAVACAGAGEPGGAEAQAFCDTAVQADMAISAGPEVDFETATEEEMGQALAAFAATVNPLLEQMVAEAPAELEESVGVLSTQLGSALETGDDAFFEEPQFVAAESAVDQFLIDNCGFRTAEIQGIEYAFLGTPEDIEPGVVAINFSNQGTELHEIAIFRIRATESASELLQLPEEEAIDKVDFVTVGFALPGESETVFVDFGTGRYAFVCFIPVGTTPDTMDLLEEGAEEGGPPHFTQGMVAELTIEG
jgi:hypothetical protein